MLVDPELMLASHSSFTNLGMALLTLFRVSTGDDWSTQMDAVARDPGPRPANATGLALAALLRFNRTRDPGALEVARAALPLCQTGEELDSLRAVITCGPQVGAWVGEARGGRGETESQ